MVVTELSPMSVVFTVPEDNISQIMPQVAQGAVLAADAWDRSQTVKLASGKLSTVDNVVDPTTGHGQAARSVRQYGSEAISQPVREYPASG